MGPEPISKFPHRLTINGFHDSICTRCHMTIASASNEEDLALFEQSHECSPIRIFQLSEDQPHARPPIGI
jgi:hypothetical protein